MNANDGVAVGGRETIMTQKATDTGGAGRVDKMC